MPFNQEMDLDYSKAPRVRTGHWQFVIPKTAKTCLSCCDSELSFSELNVLTTYTARYYNMIIIAKNYDMCKCLKVMCRILLDFFPYTLGLRTVIEKTQYRTQPVH